MISNIIGNALQGYAQVIPRAVKVMILPQLVYIVATSWPRYISTVSHNSTAAK
jgi:hypothetical protein